MSRIELTEHGPVVVDSGMDQDSIDVRLTPTPGSDKLLAELAELSKVEYDRQRKPAADELGIRKGTLDEVVKECRRERGKTLELPDPTPWDEPVNGADLIHGLVQMISRYVALPEHADVAAALWVVHAHALDAAWISPRLAITSPEKRCGKSTLLNVIGALVPRPLHAANITAAALFRAVEKMVPTLLIDEADTFLRNSDELRGILNSGHNRASAQVIRTTGDDHEPAAFQTWSAVAIAKIGGLPDTLEDRSVVISMHRRRDDETVTRFRGDRLQLFEGLARRAARWTVDNIDTLRGMDPEIPEALHDRAADNWRPLIAVADVAGGEWPSIARATALALSGEAEDGDSVRTLLLGDIRCLFERENVDRLPSTFVADELARLEDRPWPEWKGGKAITTRQLAALLKPFKITSAQMKFEGRNLWGYILADFKDTFARYIPKTATTSTTPLPAAETAPPSPAETVQSSGVAAVADISQCAGEKRNCRECGSPIGNVDLAIPFTDGSEAHMACYERAAQ